MVKRKKVTAQLFATLRPRLLQHGFERIAGGHAYRDHEATIDVIQIEFFDRSSHQLWGTSSQSFGINCGVFLKYSPNPFGGEIPLDSDGLMEPDCSICTIRTYLSRISHEGGGAPPNVWPITDDLSNLASAILDVSASIDAQAMNWFRRFGTADQILKVLRDESEQFEGASPCFGFGRKDSPIRNLFLGFSAAASGDLKTAHNALVSSLSKGGFERLSGTKAVDDAIRREIARLGGRS